MSGLGGCSFCAADAVVRVNDVGACGDHIDDAMRPVGDVVRAAREALS